MTPHRLILTLLVALALGRSSADTAHGQVVINEVVKEQRTTGGLGMPDSREFVELYNAGGGAVNIGDWTLTAYALNNGAPIVFDVIPSGTMLAAGDYFVIGAATVPNVDLVLPGGIELWPDNAGTVLELSDGSSIIDALAYETYRAPQLANATAAQVAEIGGGWYGEPHSADTSTPQSLSRYLDGRDTNSNGRDFGLLPYTPGSANDLPEVDRYAVPDVDAMAVGTSLTSTHASYVQPVVIDPAVADANNPRVIPVSPQGGRAIVAWDPSGGGNAAFSRELVNSFDLYAYFETSPLDVAEVTGSNEWESTIYGIGTTDDLFRNPNPTGLLTTDSPTRNGSTGLGWVFQKFEEPAGGNDFMKLLLVDFGDGGNSQPGGGWTVIQSLDLTGEASGWRRLAIDYDPATGAVVARFGDQYFPFNTATDQVGTFYVGYREALTGAPGPFGERMRPPTFDMVPEPSSVVIAAIAVCGVRRRTRR